MPEWPTLAAISRRVLLLASDARNAFCCPIPASRTFGYTPVRTGGVRIRYRGEPVDADEDLEIPLPGGIRASIIPVRALFGTADQPRLTEQSQ